MIGVTLLNSSLLDIPRPFLDPIDTLVEGLGIACLTIPRPLTPHTVAIITDAQRRSIAMMRFPILSELVIHDIVGRSSHLPDAHHVILVSVRTVSPICSSDPEMLQRCAHIIAGAGLHLLDWVVVGRGGLYCPRSLVELPDPWPGSVTFL